MKSKEKESGLPNARGKNRLCDAIVAFSALIFRAAHLFFWSKTPYFRVPALDEIYHHYWAKFVSEGHLIFPTAFFRAPFYPYLLGAIYSIFGEGLWPARIIQGVWGILGCVLVGILAREAFRDWKIGLVAGLIAAFSPMPALFESRLLLDWLLIPLGAATLLFFLRAKRRNNRWDCLLAGLSGGLFAITRPNILAVIPFLMLWLALSVGKDRWIKALLVILLGLLPPILPVFIHNIHHGDFSPVATQGGLNLYLGNNFETDGKTPVLPGRGAGWTIRDAWRMAEDESGKILSPGEMDGFYLRKALHFFRDNPGYELGLLGKKIALLMSPVEHGNNGNPEFFRRFSPPLRSPFGWGLIVVLAVFALPLTIRSEGTRFLLLWVIIYGGTVVLFFVNARFRLPILVGAIPIAAAGLVRAVELLGKRSFKKLIFPSALALFMLCVNLIFGGDTLSRRGLAESYFNLGNLFLREGDAAGADSIFAITLEYSPGIDRVNLNRGIIAFEREDYTGAKSFFSREIENDGDISSALLNIGVIARLEGDTAAALLFGSKSIEAGPLDIAAYINYSRNLQEFGLLDSSLIIACNGLEIDSLNRRLNLLAGAAALKMGNYETAKAYLQKAALESPSEILRLYELGELHSVEGAGAAPDSIIRGYALYNLGLLSTIEGDFNRAVDYLSKSVALAPNYTDAWSGLGTALEKSEKPESALAAFDRARQTGEISPGLYYNIGLLHARSGRYIVALAHFDSALALDTTFALAKEKSSLIKKLAAEGKIFLE